jgi:hypothetical protein
MGKQLVRISLRATTSWASTDRACWSDRELCEIGRLREACEKFASLVWENGHSDEGDPWCIAHDQERQQVILHFARIDRRYVVAFLCPPRIRWTTHLPAAVESALQELNRAK